MKRIPIECELPHVDAAAAELWTLPSTSNVDTYA
jgi:hypothetical protein